MPANKRTDVMNPPKEAIEGAAQITDEINIVAVDMQQHFKEIGKDSKPNKNNTRTIILNKVERPILSTELTEGMSIKVENDNTIER